MNQVQDDLYPSRLSPQHQTGAQLSLTLAFAADILAPVM